MEIVLILLGTIFAGIMTIVTVARFVMEIKEKRRPCDKE